VSPYANRAELSFGKAFPILLIVDSDALGGLISALLKAQSELEKFASSSTIKTEDNK
jgi:hypothetical protein